MKKWAVISYQTKLKLLGWATIPVFIISYKLAIARTFGEFKIYRQNNSSTVQATSHTTDVANQLAAKKKQIDAVLNRYGMDSSHQDRNLLAIVTGFCRDHSLNLRDYKPISVYDSDSMQTLTRVLTVEGSFKNCLGLVYALEKKYQAGRVCSVRYKSYEEINNNTTHLLCTVYIQNISAQ